MVFQKIYQIFSYRNTDTVILEIRHLELIAAVNTHGTLTRAAQELNLTQSALSHLLLALETRLGTPLFYRLGRRMSLTSAGARVLVAAERTLGELRETEQDLLRAANGVGALLRVSTECYTTYHWMPRVMRRFAERHPDVEIRIDADATRDPVQALMNGSIDVAVMMRRLTGKHLRAQPLFDDEMVLVTPVGHPLATAPYAELSALADQHLLAYSSLDDAGSFIGGHLRAAGVKPARVSRIQITEAILELVEAGVGVSVLARWAVEPQLRRGHLAATRLTASGLARTWHAVSLRQCAVARHVKSFADALSAGPRLARPIAQAAPVGRTRAVAAAR